jgi:hypothetical protein
MGFLSREEKGYFKFVIFIKISQFLNQLQNARYRYQNVGNRGADPRARQGKVFDEASAAIHANAQASA